MKLGHLLGGYLVSDMEAGYDEVERKNERAYVVVFCPFPPARIWWNTDYNFRLQFTRSKAGRPDRSRRRDAARRGEMEADDGKDGWWWSCLSMFCRLDTYYLDIFLNTNSPCLMFGLRLVIVPVEIVRSIQEPNTQWRLEHRRTRVRCGRVQLVCYNVN